MKALVFVLLTFLTNQSDLEPTGNAPFDLSGYVVEASTGEPLVGALINIKGLEKEYFTDFEGRFNINSLTPGRYDIEISYLSFESTELKEIQLDHQNNDLFVGLW